jgi:hypothetical protein
LIDEGIVKVGKITPWLGDPTQGCGSAPLKEAVFQECRFISGFCVTEDCRLGGGPRHPKVIHFYVLFDRKVGRQYADRFLFEELVPGSSRRPKIRTVDYSDVLKLDGAINEL